MVILNYNITLIIIELFIKKNLTDRIKENEKEKTKRKHIEIQKEEEEDEESDSSDGEQLIIDDQVVPGKQKKANDKQNNSKSRKRIKYKKKWNDKNKYKTQPTSGPKHPPFRNLRFRKDYTEHYEKNLRPDSDTLIFYYVGSDYFYKKGVGTVINITGNLDPYWAPIHIQVSGFNPWFAIKKPKDCDGEMLSYLMDNLNSGLKSYLEYSSKRNTEMRHLLEDMEERSLGPIVGWKLTTEEEMVEYTGEGPTEFIIVTLMYPKLVKMARDLIEFPDGREKSGKDSGERFERAEIPDVKWCKEELRPIVSELLLFEADVDFVIRHLSDTRSKPCTFFSLAPNTYNVIKSTDEDKISRANLEVSADFNDIKPVTDPKYDAVIPNFIRIVFDGEMSTAGTRFPNPKKDPVLQICMVISDLHKKTPKRKYMLCLLKVTKVEGCDHIFWYEKETDLLQAFRDFSMEVDPDIWAHHNGNGFDIKYIKERAEFLGLGREYPKMGRMLYKDVRVTSSENKGFTKWSAVVPGMLNLDIYRKAQEDTKLDEGYNLRALAKAYLKGMTKGEIHYSLISKKQETEGGRRELAVYCLRDGIVTDEIIDERKYIYDCLGFGKMTNSPPQVVLDRAQGAKLDAKLKVYCGTRNCTVDGCKKSNCEHEKNGKKNFMITTKVRRTEKEPTVYWEVEVAKLPPEKRKEYTERIRELLKDPVKRYEEPVRHSQQQQQSVPDVDTEDYMERDEFHENENDSEERNEGEDHMDYEYYVAMKDQEKNKSGNLTLLCRINK